MHAIVIAFACSLLDVIGVRGWERYVAAAAKLNEAEPGVDFVNDGERYPSPSEFVEDFRVAANLRDSRQMIYENGSRAKQVAAQTSEALSKLLLLYNPVGASAKQVAPKKASPRSCKRGDGLARHANRRTILPFLSSIFALPSSVNAFDLPELPSVSVPSFPPRIEIPSELEGFLAHPVDYIPGGIGESIRKMNAETNAKYLTKYVPPETPAVPSSLAEPEQDVTSTQILESPISPSDLAEDVTSTGATIPTEPQSSTLDDGAVQ
mmetsp:Transcript_102008/g.161209  ORF Transcript_102008/g.161209 Transcript_102008/m.161209 type:complete len:265 (-) Transcript_102008:48-842(-)